MNAELPGQRGQLRRLLLAGLLTGVVDGLFSSALSVWAYGSTATRLFQGVAGVLRGPEALQGGTSTVAIGLLLHFGVAFAWSAVFVFVALRSSWVRRLVDSPYGVLKVAALYGPLIWMVMSLAVIPAFLRRPPTIGYRWWVQLIGHIPFVGAPIVLFAGRQARPRTRHPRESPR